MNFVGPSLNAQAQCEGVLRSLPMWFGIEAALVEYAQATRRLPTFAAVEGDTVVAFVTLQQHFPQAWEIHCMAVQSSCRGTGIGRALHNHAEHWLVSQGGKFLQVKTLAALHPSPEYAQTRQFYERIGYLPLEVFPDLWGPNLPALQLVKVLAPTG